MSFAIWADYLGGHPEFERSIMGGQLRIDQDSQVLTYLAPASGPKNPVVLTVNVEERFVVAIDSLHGSNLGAADVAAALASAARGSIILGALGAASALDEHRGAHLTLGGEMDGREYRLGFMVNEADGRQLLARIDGRRSTLGLPTLGLIASAPPPRPDDADMLAVIAHRLDEQARLLMQILDRLPPSQSS